MLHGTNEATFRAVPGLDSNFGTTPRATIAELELIFHFIYSNSFFVILSPSGEESHRLLRKRVLSDILRSLHSLRMTGGKGSEWLINKHPMLSAFSNYLLSHIRLQCFGYLYAAIDLLVVL